MKPYFSHIVACTGHGVIGRDNSLPWHIPEDLRNFRIMSMGHIIIMGRKTFESIGKTLDGRLTIVVTRKGLSENLNVIQVKSLEEALYEATKNSNKWENEILIAGGGDIFNQTIDLSDKIYMTVVPNEVSGDTYYPLEKVSKNFRLEKSVYIPTKNHGNLNLRTFHKKVAVWEK